MSTLSQLNEALKSLLENPISHYQRPVDLPFLDVDEKADPPPLIECTAALRAAQQSLQYYAAHPDENPSSAKLRALCNLTDWVWTNSNRMVEHGFPAFRQVALTASDTVLEYWDAIALKEEEEVFEK